MKILNFHYHLFLCCSFLLPRGLPVLGLVVLFSVTIIYFHVNWFPPKGESEIMFTEERNVILKLLFQNRSMFKKENALTVNTTLCNSTMVPMGSIIIEEMAHYFHRSLCLECMCVLNITSVLNALASVLDTFLSSANSTHGYHNELFVNLYFGIDWQVPWIKDLYNIIFIRCNYWIVEADKNNMFHKWEIRIICIIVIGSS